MIERLFHLSENGTTVRTELIGGVTTFVTLSYIIFVQPTVLSAAGMDAGAVMVATCVTSALATFLMGFLANYPIAIAPAMGHNFFFAFTVCGPVAAGGMGYSWEVALGAVFISGALFVVLAFFGVREKVMETVPEDLRSAIAVGIGLLIALLGFEWGGLIVDAPGTLVGLGSLSGKVPLLTILGLLATAVFYARGMRGAIPLGMALVAVVGLLTDTMEFHGIIGAPPSLSPTFMKLDILGVFRQPEFITVIAIFFFLDLFDTVGTLIGVTTQAGMMKEGKLPRAGRALLSDAVGTVSGTLLGTSTVTSYIESAAGVSEGARTGLANMVTGTLLLMGLFLYPLVEMVAEGVPAADGAVLYPVMAPALILVGALMARNAADIEWKDHVRSIPAFLTITIIPLSFSITEGIAFGFIASSLLHLASGRGREVHWMVHFVGAAFLLRYVFLV